MMPWNLDDHDMGLSLRKMQYLEVEHRERHPPNLVSALEYGMKPLEGDA